jgi:dTDP-4-dehydrorhamnose reductase
MSETQVILLTGGSGQVGSQLQRTFAPLGKIVAPDRKELDLSSPESIRNMMRTLRPQWVVNPAAYTAVDTAESESDAAFAINRDAPAIFAEEAKKIGAVMIHFSTDYVFDGTKATPYVEGDVAHPLGVYGASKLAGEQAVTASGAAHMILRTSWVYSAESKGAMGKNFLLTILRLAREREELRIVADQHGAPTWSYDLAAMTAALIARINAQAARESRSVAEIVATESGIYHACSAGETTWFGFAEEALRIARAREPQQKFARLVPISTAEYPTAAQRPQNSRLDCAKLAKHFGLALPAWERSLAQVMEAI